MIFVIVFFHVFSLYISFKEYKKDRFRVVKLFLFCDLIVLLFALAVEVFNIGVRMAGLIILSYFGIWFVYVTIYIFWGIINEKLSS
jgi:hypothetical protein